MHVLIEKRHIVLAALVVMLGLAVFANWYYTGSRTQLFPEGASPDPTQQEEPAAEAKYTSAEEADYFAEAKLERAAAHSAAVEELQAVMANAGANTEEARSLQASLDALSLSVKQESDMETLITAALGGDCMAVVSGNSVDVVVTKNILGDNAVLQINGIIRSVCGEGVEDIRISAALA